MNSNKIVFDQLNWSFDSIMKKKKEILIFELEHIEHIKGPMLESLYMCFFFNLHAYKMSSKIKW